MGGAPALDGAAARQGVFAALQARSRDQTAALLAKDHAASEAQAVTDDLSRRIHAADIPIHGVTEPLLFRPQG